MKKLIVYAFIALMSLPAVAEEAVYGEVWLTGLAREVDWPYNPPGSSNAMVCNVNGPDGFLSVRSCASTNCSINRKLKRLAVLEVHTDIRDGNWVYVSGAYRNTDEWGNGLSETKLLPVTGWAHDGYLCAFIH